MGKVYTIVKKTNKVTGEVKYYANITSPVSTRFKELRMRVNSCISSYGYSFYTRKWEFYFKGNKIPISNLNEISASSVSFTLTFPSGLTTNCLVTTKAPQYSGYKMISLFNGGDSYQMSTSCSSILGKENIDIVLTFDKYISIDRIKWESNSYPMYDCSILIDGIERYRTPVNERTTSSTRTFDISFYRDSPGIIL